MAAKENSVEGGEEYGDVRKAASMLKVSASYLNKARMSGDGPPYAKFGFTVRYHLPTLREWAASRCRHSTSQTEAV